LPAKRLTRSGGLATGTVNPGVIWVSHCLQAGVEAIIPTDALSGRDPGARAQITSGTAKAARN
jgi:hypothetical protein